MGRPRGHPGRHDIGDYASALSTVLPTAAKSILVLRDGEFLVPALVPVSGQPVREPLRCRPDAAYLITGGMGALGLLMAAWLADRGARRLVLAGRTPLPPRRDWDSDTNDTDVRHKIAAIRALEMRGVSVDAVALDVGSRDAVQALLARRDGDAAPPIRGVIHAAGITESQLLTEIAYGPLRRTMWPKIAGAQALHEAFPPASLDFFFLTASAGTVFGIPGRAPTRQPMRISTAWPERVTDKAATPSVWTGWPGRDSGSPLTRKSSCKSLNGWGRGRSPRTFTAWEHLQCYEVAQAVMAPMPSSDGSASAASDTHRISPAKWTWSQTPAENMLTELEIGLRTILARELHLPEAELELDRPFAELGLNSVMAMSIRREAEQLVGIELSATMLWNHPTIASLAEYLAKSFTTEQLGKRRRCDARFGEQCVGCVVRQRGIGSGR